ncbi:MAG: hypothetical protein PHR35_07455, partial [Kiritimatiellae bacterium]|nr:hypothetical protein [Kiritimatiellia bacterium]
MRLKRVWTVVLCSGWLMATMSAGFPPPSADKQGAGKEARRTYGPDDLRKMISVVKAKTPPTIDGVMTKGEWDDAAAIAGLTKVWELGQWGVHGASNDSKVNRIGVVASDQSRFWITYDDDNLYIAYRSPPPARPKDSPAGTEGMLKRTQTGHDTNIDWDDSIDIEVMLPTYLGFDDYVIQINSIGTTFDCIWGGTPAVGSTVTVGWDPRVVNKSTLTLDGWVMETAIPWKDFGPKIEKPQPGEIKFMNFGRLWRTPADDVRAWAAWDGFRPNGEVRFAGDDGIVVQVADTGNLAHGQAVFAARIKNVSSAERKVIAEVATDSGELKDKKELTLKPGGSAPYRFEGTIDFAATNCATTKIAFTVTEATAGQVVHVTTLPVIRPPQPDLSVRKYQRDKILEFETDLASIGVVDYRNARIALEVTDKAARKRVFRKTFKGFTSSKPALQLSTRKWVPGAYEARCVVSAPGMQPHEKIVAF